MSKITTEDCKEFIAQFQRNNPELEYARFQVNANTVDSELKIVFMEAQNSKNWKRTYKRKPDLSQSYMAYVSGAPLNSYAEPQELINVQHIESERGFDLSSADGQIAYIVLEMKDGTLRLGDYIGD